MKQFKLVNPSLVAAIGLSAMTAMPAMASSNQELLDTLLANGVITAEQHAALAATVKDEVNISTKGGLKAKTADGEFDFQVGGRIMVDATAGLDDDSNINDMNTGTEFRRARLFMKGTVYNDWGYKLQLDFSDDDLAMKDAYIQYKPMNIKVGQFKMPFSLEEHTSSKYITFMERGLPNVFSTGRRVGLGWNTSLDNMTFATAVYGQEAGNGDENEEGFGIGARATFAPMNEAGKVLHLGAAVAMEKPNDASVDTLRLRSRPEVHNAPRLVDTGTFGGVDDITKLGLEAAWVTGPFSLQSEWMTYDVSGNTGMGDADFDGYYAYASWFLTGESRPYEGGEFGRVKPMSVVGKGGSGAWEVAARYSELDLNDGLIAGGELETITLGLNWYATNNIRFMMNYVMAEADYGLGVTDEPDVIQVRAQIDW
ncbi:MAG: porin [Gammaproteobacteria bacterium]|nr:porin [Gammaproteobacteria bacterium]